MYMMVDSKIRVMNISRSDRVQISRVLLDELSFIVFTQYTICQVEVLDFTINVCKAKGFRIVAMSLCFGYKSTSQSLQ